jgi:hypothetical protein
MDADGRGFFGKIGLGESAYPYCKLWKSFIFAKILTAKNSKITETDIA